MMMDRVRLRVVSGLALRQDWDLEMHTGDSFDHVARNFLRITQIQELRILGDIKEGVYVFLPTLGKVVFVFRFSYIRVFVSGIHHT
jgi:hypothetical protein